ncbi:nucleotidyltransferase family protein [Rhizobium tumorigenes]|uniref:nucleotidyltransferase family protein n=1 Tax=Rhizobium tumorigenes TaxID=2041385 RepID=UPI00241D914C|nr:nucleotidyltransferase family protein [Rhizobium tumorigenes]WFS00703.1 nucleotidyltransferase family protein [Rhizobium tumorigenes]
MTIKQAMVLAAGLGTRMRPITDHTPKPLVKIGGKPMLDYVLDLLVAAGVDRVAINIHHHPDQMRAYLQTREGLEIVVSDETGGLMNSGGGLAKGLKLLGSSPVLVMNADLFWIGETPGAPTNLERLADVFDAGTMDMALLCVPLEKTTGHDGKKDFSMAADGCLTRYREGMTNPVVYAGAIALHPALFDEAPDEAFNLNLYFDRAIASGRLYGMILEGEWLTVGTPDAIEAAEETLRRIGTSEPS